MGLLRTLLIILLVYYVIRVLMRLFAPFLVRQASRKVHREFQKKYGQHQQETKQYKTSEGEVIIDKKPSGKTKSGQKVGEYIDFEEID